MIAVPSPPSTLGRSALLAYTRRPGLEILLSPVITFSFLSAPYFNVIWIVLNTPSSTMSYFSIYPSSNKIFAIANILLDEGYITKYDVIEDGIFKTIHITLKYGVDKNEKVITGLKRISKPGLRVYANSADIPKVMGGLGTAIISTNKGVITDKEARKLGVGGEVLCYVW